MCNYPAGVTGNEDYFWDKSPDPEDCCPHCLAPYIRRDADEEIVDLDKHRRVHIVKCAACYEPIEAWLEDWTKPYLEYIRKHPEEALEETVDEYSELRELPKNP